VVVAAGFTLTAVPLLAAMFPGVITPVPPLKTPVRLAVDPASMVVGLPLKLVIVGGVPPPPPPPPEFPPPQPARPTTETLAHTITATKTLFCFMALPRSRVQNRHN
jgi:hypothetical protein